MIPMGVNLLRNATSGGREGDVGEGVGDRNCSFQPVAERQVCNAGNEGAVRMG